MLAAVQVRRSDDPTRRQLRRVVDRTLIRQRLIENDREVRFHESARYAQGMIWHDEDDDPTTDTPAVQPMHRINGAPPGIAIADLKMTRRNAADLARPSSAHVDGVNMAFADGATRFVSDSIDYKVYRALLTPGGQETEDARLFNEF